MLKKFEDILVIKNGRNQKNVENPNGKYPIYGSGGVIGYANDYICDANTVVIGRKGSINNPIFVDTPFWNVDTAFGLVPNEKVVLPRYLFYFCKIFDFEKLNTTVTIPSLTKANLLNIQINIPPIMEQQIIIQKLHKLEDIIEYRKQQLDILNTLIKARFVEMFGENRTNPKGWDTIQLERLADVGSSKRVFVEELQRSGIPFYRGTEVGALAEGQNVTPELHITEKHYQRLITATGAPTKGDLLMPSICPDGRIWLVNTDKPFYFKDGRVLWIHPTSDRINSCYLQYVLKEKIMTDYTGIASGTTFAELKIFALKSLPVMMAPLKLQKQFAAFVTQVDKSKVALEHASQ